MQTRPEFAYGLCSAPILSDIFVCCVDKGLLRSLPCVHIYRYVNDCLAILMDKVYVLPIDKVAIYLHQ